MTLEEIRAGIIAWTEEHRATCHLPPEQCSEPLNALAFLIHAVGVQSADMWYLEGMVREYEANCVGDEPLVVEEPA